MFKRQLEMTLDLSQKCVKCALCKSVCPTYPYVEEEGGFARGRLMLAEMLLKGEIPQNKEAYKHLDQCAMCRRCEWICPNAVEYKEVIVSARDMQDGSFIKESGLKALDVLQSSTGRKAAKLLGKLMDKLPFEEIKVPFPTGAVKFMPKPDGKAFDLRGKTFKAKEERGRLLFFTGCMIDAFYTKTGESVIKLMNKAGWTVIVPENIKCCGAPHYYSGNISAFEKLRGHNIKEMQKYEHDALVVACPTCGGALQEDYGIEKKVYDFSELVHESQLVFKGAGEKTTFHVPCHSYSAMKTSEKVFYGVIHRVDGDKLVKGEKDKSCCGFAGLFSITDPELSKNIQREKIEDVKKTGARLVLTSCPGCVLNLRDGTRAHQTGQKVMHLADYLAERLI